MAPGGRYTVAAMVLALVLAGCPEEDDLVSSERAGMRAFSDGEVLEAARALEHGLLQSVVAVRGRLRGDQARQLADDLLEESRAARERAMALGERLDEALAPTPLSQELERVAELRLARWIDAPAQAASEWLSEQVEVQRAALDTIDAHLLPSARAPEVRELLRDMRRLASEHLERAEAANTHGG